MEFTTKVNIEPITTPISYKNKILLMGSCFADEIGKELSKRLFNVIVNPFGTLYNPYSIANSLERLSNNQDFTEKEIIKSGAIYTSFSHHSSIYGNTPDEFLALANTKLKEDSQSFNEADTLIITLGTAWIYKHVKQDTIVSNCHKIKAAEFERSMLSIEECKEQLLKIVNLFPGGNLIITVSPIRHLKDGAHRNQLSKSTLLLAVDEVIKSNSPSKDHVATQSAHQGDDYSRNTINVHNSTNTAVEINQPQEKLINKTISYFPSYEIMMDELRDYRFYALDMVHPSQLAIEYIFERFSDTFISQESHKLMQEGLRLHKALNHRPLFPDSETYTQFKQKTEEELSRFKNGTCCSPPTAK